MDLDAAHMGAISHALRLAAERYNESARLSTDPRIVTQFERQAAEARCIYNLISERTGIAN